MARRASGSNPRLSPLWHRTAVMLTVLWLVVPVLASAHGVEQSHRYCNEHGAFEHGQQLRAGGVSDTVGAVSTRATIETATTSIVAQHEVCAFSASILREATTPYGATFSASATLDDHQQAAACCSQTHAPQLALLRISPKSSPPHAQFS